jgi:hypothetical protein
MPSLRLYHSSGHCISLFVTVNSSKVYLCFQAILDTEQHSISYTLSRNQAVIVEYMPDDETDMFQVRVDSS